MSAGKVFGPERCGEAIADAVCVSEDFLFGIKRHDGHDRAEDLFLIGAAIVGQPLDDGRLDKPTRRFRILDFGFWILHYPLSTIHWLTSGQHRSAFGLGEVDVGEDLLEMLF